MAAPIPARLGYTDEDLLCLSKRAGGEPLAAPEDIRRVIDSYDYQEDWRENYCIQSARSSLWSSRITCIDGAILAYGLLELLFEDTPRRLLAIHRRDPHKNEECGHCVALYRTADGRFGSFSKSSLKGLGHRDPVFVDELSIATSYAEAYVEMGFQPLYFGVTTLEEAAPDLDWRFHDGPLNAISDRLQATYEFGFMVEEKTHR